MFEKAPNLQKKTEAAPLSKTERLQQFIKKNTTKIKYFVTAGLSLLATTNAHSQNTETPPRKPIYVGEKDNPALLRYEDSLFHYQLGEKSLKEVPEDHVEVSKEVFNKTIATDIHWGIDRERFETDKKNGVVKDLDAYVFQFEKMTPEESDDYYNRNLKKDMEAEALKWHKKFTRAGIDLSLVENLNGYDFSGKELYALKQKSPTLFQEYIRESSCPVTKIIRKGDEYFLYDEHGKLWDIERSPIKPSQTKFFIGERKKVEGVTSTSSGWYDPKTTSRPNMNISKKYYNEYNPVNVVNRYPKPVQPIIYKKGIVSPEIPDPADQVIPQTDPIFKKIEAENTYPFDRETAYSTIDKQTKFFTNAEGKTTQPYIERNFYSKNGNDLIYTERINPVTMQRIDDEPLNANSDQVNTQKK